ncbi:MAG: TnpV protein [Bacilli bacterium]|nr:TnpV protein [Clostridia bacterium]MCI9435452.1 TnpV protein [Bacilli bacterium]
MLEKNPIDKNFKNTNPLQWTNLMNNYKNLVEKIILKEFIYF